jgi:uncharacterized membrane protein YhaH (DUF805 family)
MANKAFFRYTIDGSFKKLFDFNSRASRKEYLAVFFGQTILLMLLLIPIALLLGFISGAASLLAVLNGLDNPLAQLSILFEQWLMMMVILFPLGLIILISNISVIFRRLHDLGLSGWWYVVYLILVPQMPYPLAGMLMLLQTILLIFIPGNNFPNKYGSDPRQE